MDLESVAAALYGLRPEEFTAARNVRAKEARQAGDTRLAAAIASLRRPTTSAWLVNALVRDRAEQVEDLLSLGDALREAQESLAGDALRQLSRQRRQVVSAVGREARRLALARGIRVSEPVQREVEETLDAALADPGAADAVRSGRLTAALSYSGLGPVDRAGAVALKGSGKRARLRSVPAGEVPPAEVVAAERAVQEARAAVQDARQAAESEQRRAAAAAAAHDEVRRRVRALEDELEQARSQEAVAGDESRAAKRAAAAAAKEVTAASRRLDSAESAVRQLPVRRARHR